LNNVTCSVFQGHWEIYVWLLCFVVVFLSQRLFKFNKVYLRKKKKQALELGQLGPECPLFTCVSSSYSQRKGSDLKEQPDWL
jgi:hypothetical protein